MLPSSNAMVTPQKETTPLGAADSYIVKLMTNKMLSLYIRFVEAFAWKLLPSCISISNEGSIFVLETALQKMPVHFRIHLFNFPVC